MPTSDDGLQALTSTMLFRQYASILEELRCRGLVRSSNNPVADLAEHLVAKALDLDLAGKSSAGYDATDKQGLRYQIKARRMTAHNKSRQLSFIRGLDSTPFDFLVGLLFNADFSILRGCLVPIDVVVTRSTFVAKMNAHRLLLTDGVWLDASVRDLTELLKAASESLQ